MQVKAGQLSKTSANKIVRNGGNMVAAKTADIPANEQGRQYHIGLAPGEILPTILLVGDPTRAHRIGKMFSNPTTPITNREYVTISGKWKDLPISVMATGMGPDNTEIAVVEISQIVKNPTFIRIGTTGGLQPHINIGDLVVSTGAVRCENTSTAFVPEGYPAVAHHEVTLALIAAAEKLKAKFHTGVTASGSGFYGIQGRKVPGFPPRHPEFLDELTRIGVCNFEMEASCLFTLATLSGARAGAVCGVIAQRNANKFVDDETKDNLELLSIEVGLEAALILSSMDSKRGGAKHWTPNMGI